MTSIYSGKLMQRYVADQNQQRLSTFDVNRFNKTIPQIAASSRAENEAKEALEYHQARMGELQTRLSEVTEKLTNLYRKYMSNNVAFRKVSSEPLYTGTSSLLNGLPDINNPSGLPLNYPTLANGILPFGDPGLIRNYSYNPYFGSKAIDESDQQVIRTHWQDPGDIAEEAYRENGAFWSAISYLWGWDVDRINATYTTTSNLDNKQINVTALQPNKEQYPPLRPGDRFPVKWQDDPINTTAATYPAVTIKGIRPGGVDYSHATDSLNTGGDGAASTAHTNVVGNNSTNWGWEFDDLPLAMEVVSVSKQPDGNTVPTAYKIVYDIPPDHPFYNELKVLNGTEPQIHDAPTELVKERINNQGFKYAGTIYFPGSNVVGFSVGPTFTPSHGPETTGQPGESEYSAPGNYTVASGPIASFDLQTCLPGVTIDANTKVSFKYRFRVHQNSGSFGSTWDDHGPGVPNRFDFDRHDWDSNLGTTYGTGNTHGRTMPANYQVITNQSAATLFSIGKEDNANSSGTDYIKTSGYEELFAKVVPVPGDDTAVRLEFYFDGDLNDLEIEVSDFQILDYTGTLNTWEQGKYNDGNVNPVIYEGDPNYTTNPTDVISKYYPGVYQFTQFNDQYTNSYSAFDRNDILRSPWEFGLLNIDEESGLSGEMYLDLNGRRLNLDHDAVAQMVGLWNGTIAAPVGAGTAMVQQAAIQKAYEFLRGTQTQPVHPDDDCGPNPDMEVIGAGTGAANSPIIVDGFSGFTAGSQIVINGSTYTIASVTQSGGSPATTVAARVVDDQNAPNPGDFVLLPPFDGSYTITTSPGPGTPLTINDPYGGTVLPIDISNFPIIVNGTTYADYAALGLAFAADADNPNSPTATNPDYWIAYTSTTYPAVPSRKELYLTSPPGASVAVGTIITSATATTAPKHLAQFADSDPLTDYILRHVLLHDEVRAGELPLNPSMVTPLDPGRTANPVTGSAGDNSGYVWSDADFYSVFGFAFTNPPSTTGNPTNFITGVSNDNNVNTNPNYSQVDGTIDRVAGSDPNIAYRISIPTNDVNVLRKENNLLFNFGSIDERDWSIAIKNPYMEFRTVVDYKTVPRYRVDSGGNIYDAFGKGFYDEANSAADQASVDRLYTKAGGATLNNQVSNLNKSYDLAANYQAYNTGAIDFETFITNKDRLSMKGDELNLFDYIPDLNEIPNHPEGALFGESYVGSLPTNFYYYREGLDVSQTGGATDVPTAGSMNNDGKPALNFNASRSNRTGIYNDPDTTLVYNAETPTWANVRMGVTEQKAGLHNSERTTTFASWQGFPGLGNPKQSALQVKAESNVLNSTSALGAPNSAAAVMSPGGSSITLNMNQMINQSGHLLLHELVAGVSIPHAIPLPLFDTASFPANTPTSYVFDGYGPETVTRTGSRYISDFKAQILDGVDGAFDGSWTNANVTTLLQAAGATVSTSNPPSSWTTGLIMHVDDAAAFDVEDPRNLAYLGDDKTVLYRVLAKNPQNSPQTLYLEPVSGTVAANLQANVHADLQVRQLTGQITISAVNAAGATDANGTYIKIDYADQNTDRPLYLDAVELSGEMDRVGRLAGDDPRTPGDESQDADIAGTPAYENRRIGPEVFDSPRGYVQADAQINLNLTGQDKDGNPIVRKLKRVMVEVDSGEQIIPFTNSQVYSTDGNSGNFAINGEWPIAIYEGNRQLNPYATEDLDILVGLRQGITNGAQATNATTPTVTVTSPDGFGVGEQVTINGEQRTIMSITGNDLVLDKPLGYPPKLGDNVFLGENNQGQRGVSLFLNKSYAMSTNAPVRITLEYEEFQVTGYPPTVDLNSTPTIRKEVLGFDDSDPANTMQVSVGNTGTGVAGNPVNVDSITGFAVNDTVSVGGATYKIAAFEGVGLVLDRAITPGPVAGSTVSRTDYENYMVVGNGRSGGSFDNDFTKELKRIIDDPKYKEMLRYDLFKNIFITASINDPFNDMISSKLMLTWDRRQREAETMQTAFWAYYKSI